MDVFNLNDKKALVTGASKGIGAEIARVFAEAGADVGIIGRDKAGLTNTATIVRALQRECFIIPGDLSTAEGAEEIAQTALNINPEWDILVNNAGVAPFSNISDISSDELSNTFNTNFNAALIISQKLVKSMKLKRSGKIINISSLSAFFGTPGFATYAASKAALNQLTRTMTVELGPFNIQVNTICPTIILTDKGTEIWSRPEMESKRKEKENRIPLHRFGTPVDVAYACLFLASSAADFISGVSLPVDGGMTISP